MTIKGPLAIVLLAILGLSLAVNLVIAGYAVARYAAPRQAVLIEQLVTLGTRAFPPEIRRAVIAEALGRGRDLRTAIAGFREARQDVLAAMKAEPYDQAGLDTAFAEVRERLGTLQLLGQEIVSSAIRSATPEARAKINPAAIMGEAP